MAALLLLAAAARAPAAAAAAAAPSPKAGWPFTQEGLQMPRSQMGLALFDEAVRLWGPGRGSVAIRDYTATGLKQPMFPPMNLAGGATVDAGFPANTAGTGDESGTGYSFNLAFRDELSRALIIDAQDELDQLMLYPDQRLGGASCGHGLECQQLGLAGVSSKLTMPHQDTLWQPNKITRTFY